MNKEEFKRNLLIQQIYEKLKDDFKVNTTSHIRYYLKINDYELTSDEIRKVYIKITNYRIKKYGNSIVFKEMPKEKNYIIQNDYAKLK